MRTMAALILREMGSTYGQSPGGYLWAILQPLGMIMVLSIGFSLLLRSPSLGTSFLLFYATGYLPFDLYGQVASKTMSALKYSRPLLAYPRVTWLEAILARFVLNLLTVSAVSCILLTLILAIEPNRSIITLGYVLQGFAMCALLGLGIGMVNCLLSGLFPVWKNAWAIISRPLFLASGILYIFEDLPVVAQQILWFNPLIHGTALSRKGFYPTYDASFVSIEYGFGFALVCMLVGMLFMRTHYRTILETN